MILGVNFNNLFETVKNNVKFNSDYSIFFMDKNSFEKIMLLLSEMRLCKEVDYDEYKCLANIHRHYYSNSNKIKTLESLEPRKIAQKFIGNKKIRTFILTRDKGVCLKCGSAKKLQLDHIVAISRGGENKISNLQTLCGSCNSKKSNNYKDYR